MQVQAVHPAFINTIVTDHWAPDFTSCDMTHDPHFPADARRKTFYETPTLWLTGYNYASFWRPADVPVRVGDHVEPGFHFIQLWVLYRERAEEVLVLYPPDGYWRIRPCPSRHALDGLRLVLPDGPVETDQRPIVALKDIVFDPQNRTFTLNFKRGGWAKVAIKTVDQDRIALDVTYSDAMPDDLPFAALRLDVRHRV